MKRKTKEKDEPHYNYTEIADPKLPLLKLIAQLLNHPETNPHVIEWVDQNEGIFRIKNTKEFAKFRGKKRNGIEFLDFQHINRNIKYHATPRGSGKRTAKLFSIPGERLTYQFKDHSDRQPTETDMHLFSTKCGSKKTKIKRKS